MGRAIRTSAAAAVAVAAIAAAAAPAASAKVTFDCTPADLADSRNPIGVHAVDGGPAPDFLIAGRAYRVTADWSFTSGSRTDAVEGSFDLAAPPGVKLTPGPARASDQTWTFVAPKQGGSLELRLGWLAATRDEPVSHCRATATRELEVRRLERVKVGRGRLARDVRGHHIFALPLTVPKLALTDPVTIRLWVRGGTVSPPAARGHASATATMAPGARGSFERQRGTELRLLRGAGVWAELLGRYGVVVAPADKPRSRFAFTVEVRQGGQKIGGFASGAVCRRVPLVRGWTPRCRAVGLRQL